MLTHEMSPRAWGALFPGGFSMNQLKWLVLLPLTALACSSGSTESGGGEEGTTRTDQQELRACVETALCIQGYVWSQKTCSCVPEKQHGGVTCGTKTCGAGQYCCNSSCGICAPFGSACIQIVCATQ